MQDCRHVDATWAAARETVGREGNGSYVRGLYPVQSVRSTPVAILLPGARWPLPTLGIGNPADQ
jgi:hypothetical protein